MAPQRRTALISVAAAIVLIAVKLASGLTSGSLGLVAEAVHSGTDLVAALLTFFAVGYAVKPADSSHPYGHGKAEHLAALGEASTLALVSVGIAALAVARLAGWARVDVRAAWWTFAAVGVVLAVDAVRTVVSWRAARAYSSAALLSNALHFASDFAGTSAVLLGLVAVRAGWQAGDSLAAFFVAALALLAAARLMRRNVDVLMDQAPADAVEAARDAIEALEPPVVLRRLRLRQAAGHAFADVVIGVAPGAVVGQGHAAADHVEAAVHRVLPGSDVVVHVEPVGDEAGLPERVRAAAMGVVPVREVHNL
ncbi:MAG: cation diffusion facilitator family transporter, partial [Gaiellaceae bacterium]